MKKKLSEFKRGFLYGVLLTVAIDAATGSLLTVLAFRYFAP